MKKVLLASASRAFLNRNTNLLLKRGFQLFTATSGAEALKLHEEHFFDLILSDLELEDMAGNKFCSLAHTGDAFWHVPVILTCHNTPASIEKVRQSGASAILVKPIDPIQLVETIGRFIDLQIGKSKRVILKVTVMSRKDGQEFTCFSHDLSNTGILLETDYHLELGNRIVCRFTLPGSYQIEAEGEVIRSMCTLEGNSLYGIKFIDLSLSFRRWIDDYVASNAHASNPARNHSPHPPQGASPRQ